MEILNSLLAIINEMSPYVLLGFFIAGLLHAFVKPSMMSRHLSGEGLGPVVKAALLGIPLPLCSCGVLPTAVSLRRAGASNAAATSFLIATPQTGVDSIAATYSLLGPAMAVTRPVAALVCAVFGGAAVGRFAPSKPSKVDEPIVTTCDCDDHSQAAPHGFWGRILEAMRYGFVDMIEHVGKWLVIGLVVAALITALVPDNLFLGLAQYPLVAMIVMVLIAVPMYICATGSIPIALSLMIKGLTPGVAFVLLMAGPAANFASILVLKRSLGARATGIYVVSVVIIAIAFGLLIDYVLPSAWFVPPGGVGEACCHGAHLNVFDTICSAALVALLCYALIIKRINSKSTIESIKMKRVYKITGMMCPHCQNTVKTGLENLEGVDEVLVDLGKSTAEVAGNVAPETVIAKVHALGYEAALID